MPKMDKDTPEVFIILFHPVVQRADVFLVQKAQYTLFQLSAALARDDLYQFDAFVKGLLDDAVQFRFDFIATVVDIVQVKF